jgi:hypothetical protein
MKEFRADQEPERVEDMVPDFIGMLEVSQQSKQRPSYRYRDEYTAGLAIFSGALRKILDRPTHHRLPEGSIQPSIHRRSKAVN